MDSETPERVGEYLKASRESIGLAVDEVSLITKIRAQYIEAIENGDFSIFSSPHLLKGYVKLLAKTVKADEAKAAALLEAEAGENFKGRHIEDIVGKRFKEEIQKSEEFKKRIIVIVVAGIIVIILSYATIKVYEYIKTSPGIHIALPFKSLSKKLVPEGGSSAKGKPAKIPEAIAGHKPEVNYAVVLKGNVVKRTWVAVKIDGGSTATSMLYAGDKEAWKAKKRLSIKIGNAGGIILNYNGKALGKPGGEKQVVTLTFPPKSNAGGNK
jgi:hypothetical protein